MRIRKDLCLISELAPFSSEERERLASENKKEKLVLDELIENITPENCHAEISFGPPHRKEIIPQ